MKSRILVAVIGVPVLLYVVLSGPPLLMMAALSLLAGIGAMELQQCVSGVKRSELVGISAGAAVFTVAWYYDRPDRIAILFLLELLIFFGTAIAEGGKLKFQQIMAGLGAVSLLAIHFPPSSAWMPPGSPAPACSCPSSSALPVTPSPFSRA